MLTLYYSPGACSLAAHIILEELNKPYTATRVDLKTHQFDSQDFYKINPLGKVPTLVLDNGEILTQNSAILTYLGDLDQQRKLMPPAGSMARLRCEEWIGFINSDLHKGFGPIFRPANYVSAEAAKEELKIKTIGSLSNLFKLVDNKLKGKQYAMGEDFTIVDAYLFVLYRWAEHTQLPVHEWDNYTALFQRISARSVVVKVLQAEGLMK